MRIPVSNRFNASWAFTSEEHASGVITHPHLLELREKLIDLIRYKRP